MKISINIFRLFSKIDRMRFLSAICIGIEILPGEKHHYSSNWRHKHCDVQAVPQAVKKSQMFFHHFAGYFHKEIKDHDENAIQTYGGQNVKGRSKKGLKLGELGF